MYKIKKLVDNNKSVVAMKPGPKNKTVLIDKKLEEIRKAIKKNKFQSTWSLAREVNLAKSTTYDGLNFIKKSIWVFLPRS